MPKYYLRLLLFNLLLIIGLSSCKKSGSDGCIDESKKRNNMCTTEYDPVCGCNGKTYGNACEAGRDGVTSFIKGECSE